MNYNVLGFCPTKVQPLSSVDVLSLCQLSGTNSRKLTPRRCSNFRLTVLSKRNSSAVCAIKGAFGGAYSGFDSRVAVKPSVTLLTGSEWPENEQLFGLFQLFLFRNMPKRTRPKPVRVRKASSTG